MIELVSVSKKFTSGNEEIEVLKDINLVIENGEKIAVVGASGSGKTTMLSIIGTILKPTKGEVIIDGVDVSKLDEKKLTDFRKGRIGFIFQNGFLIDELTVEENLKIFSGKNSGKNIDEILSSLGIEHKKKRFPWELSGGEYQRVAIARALILNPKIVIADEPTGNLDPPTAEKVVNEMIKLTEGKTLIIATHSEKIANKMDKIYKIENGKLQKIK